MSGPQPVDACPDCGADIAGVGDRCPACGAGLDAERLVTVFKTADTMLLAIVKSALEASGLSVVVQGENALGLFPLGSLSGRRDHPSHEQASGSGDESEATGFSRNLLAASIQVPHRDAGAALDIIREAAEVSIDGEDEDEEEGA